MLNNFIILMLCIASLQLLPAQANKQTTRDAEIVSAKKFNESFMIVSAQKD